jgi:hypothetical protein
LLVRSDPGHAPLLQHTHGVREDPAGVNGVPGDDRHHHVELELATVCGRHHGRIAADDLVADLVHHFRN